MQFKWTKSILTGVCIIVAGVCYSCAVAQKESFVLETLISSEEILEMSEDLTQAEASSIWVYVCGEVKVPGVYELKAGSRIFEAIDAAGGMTEQAAQEAVNLALLLSDGQQIQIPSKDEAQKMSQEAENGTSNGKIQLNTATKAQLMELSGIGESKAEAILQYRLEHGNFQSIEEIKNVSGIGDALFEQIKESITVE